MSTNTDASANANPAAAAAAEASAALPGVNSVAKKQGWVRKVKAAFDKSRTATQSSPNQDDAVTQAPMSDSGTQTTDGVEIAATDPTWFVEPGAAPTTSDAGKPSWFSAPTAQVPTLNDTAASSLGSGSPAPSQAATVARGPSLSAMGSSAMYIGIGGAGLGLLGAAAGGKGGTSAPKEPTVTIKVVDGPINGAAVYSDTKDNGRYDAGEDTWLGTTGPDGTLSVASALLGKHGLVTDGGTDGGKAVSTRFSLLMTGTSSLVVVSPLTTLASAVYLQAKSETPLTADYAVAEAKVKTALGITDPAPLSGMDPTAAGNLQLLKAGAVLASLAAIPLPTGVSVQDSVVNYIRNHTFTPDATLLDLLKTSEGMQTVLSSSLNSTMLTASDRALALATIDILAPYNQVRLGANSINSLLSAPIPTPKIVGLENPTGPSATYDPTINIASLNGTTTKISIDGGSTWKDPSTVQWPDGSRTVLAQSSYVGSDGRLVTSGISNPFTFTLHTTVPQTPTIRLIDNTGASNANIQTQNGALAVSANRPPGSVLEYSTDFVSWTPWAPDGPATTDEGTYTVYVRQVFLDSGRASAFAPSASVTFTVDHTIHAGKVVIAGNNDSGDLLHNDVITAITRPLLVGEKTEPGNKIELTLLPTDTYPDAVTYTVLADAQGNWSFSPPDDYSFREGENSIQLRITDAAQNSVSPLLKFTVDTELHLGTVSIKDTFPDLGSRKVFTHNHTPWLIGATSEIGAKVNVSLEMPDHHTVVFQATTEEKFINGKGDGIGHWQIMLEDIRNPNAELVCGAYSPVIKMTDRAGNNNIAVPATPSDFTLLPGPDATGYLSSEDTGASNSDGLTSQTATSFEGTLTPGSIVVGVLVDGVEVTDLSQLRQVGNNWHWSGTISDDGVHTVSLYVHNDAFDVGSQDSLVDVTRLTIDTIGPDAIALGSAPIEHAENVFEGPDGTLYLNNSNANADTVALTFRGTADQANYGATLELQLVTSDGTTVDAHLGTVSASMVDGSWAYAWNGLVSTLDGMTPAPDGTYFVRATATDLAGNHNSDVPVALFYESEQGFVIDHIAPILTAGIDSLDITSLPSPDSPNISYTHNTMPTLSGQINDPSIASVFVTVDNISYAGVVSELGDYWSLDLSTVLDTALLDGPHTVSLVATDLAGNVGGSVALKPFIVDTVPQYFSVADPVTAPTVYGSVLGTPVQMTLGKNYNVALLAALNGTVDVASSGAPPISLSLDDTGHLIGKPVANEDGTTDVGITWLAIHSLDQAGNESITNVQLAITGATPGSRLPIDNTDPTAAKAYTGTTSANAYNLANSAGDVLKTGDGNDIINAIGQVDDGHVAAALIDGGNGVDTLNFANVEHLDFSKFNDPLGGFGLSPIAGVIQNVEIFAFADGSEITLSAADIFKLRSGSTDAAHSKAAVVVMDIGVNQTGAGLKAHLSGLSVVDGNYAYSKTGTTVTVTSNSAGNYDLYEGHYVDNAGDHLVEVLIQNNFVIG